MRVADGVQGFLGIRIISILRGSQLSTIGYSVNDIWYKSKVDTSWLFLKMSTKCKNCTKFDTIWVWVGF